MLNKLKQFFMRRHRCADCGKRAGVSTWVFEPGKDPYHKWQCSHCTLFAGMVLDNG